MTEPRRLAGRVLTCRVCRKPVVFARTVAGPNGPGGKAIPLDVVPNEDGNVAVRDTGRGRLLARVLGKDDVLDRTSEVLAMPHFASCTPALADEVEAFLRQVAEGGKA